MLRKIQNKHSLACLSITTFYAVYNNAAILYVCSILRPSDCYMHRSYAYENSNTYLTYMIKQTLNNNL